MGNLLKAITLSSMFLDNCSIRESRRVRLSTGLFYVQYEFRKVSRSRRWLLQRQILHFLLFPAASALNNNLRHWYYAHFSYHTCSDEVGKQYFPTHQYVLPPGYPRHVDIYKQTQKTIPRIFQYKSSFRPARLQLFHCQRNSVR